MESCARLFVWRGAAKQDLVQGDIIFTRQRYSFFSPSPTTTIITTDTLCHPDPTYREIFLLMLSSFV